MPTTEFAPDARDPSPSDVDVDSLIAKFGASGGTEQQQASALKAIAGLDPTPPPAPPEMAPGSRPPRAVPAPMAPPRRASPRSGAGESSERQLPTQPSQLKKTRPTLPSVSLPSSRTGGGFLAVLAVLAIAAGSYAVWQLRPDVMVRHVPGAESTAMPLREAQTACVGTLVVADVPQRAEVLVHEGQAPVDIPRMPVGTRLEFVATAEGYTPKRVVVPAGAVWDPGPDGKPRFEAAVQLDPSRARAGEPWPAGEPGSAVGGEGPPGTVRVVASPRGAEVWMLAGIAPEARIDHLQCDQDFDVLLAGPTTYRRRLHVGANDFVPADNRGAAGARARVARVSGK